MTYTVKVLNASGFAKCYALFMPPPQLGAGGGQPTVWTNVWVTFTAVLPNGIDSITYTDQTFAYWTTSTQSADLGTTVGQSGFAAVSAATSDSVAFAGTAPVGFGQVTAGGATAGAYRIVASTDFDASNGYLFGLAFRGGIPELPSPVATFLAQPNDHFDVKPTAGRCYVVDGAYATGTVIDHDTLVAKAGAVDFTDKAQTTAVVIQGTDGVFTTQYY